ncbi:MAG TPA: gamma-glutamyl-gamma-aminobutyrate hydrolase family protein [Desulfomicrobiaceae bacterium]|nr:gamma-glutamyl-gamma-aminobutyrate hydrolase family protein [Desulfomicrobiaceae bacterium]
MAALRTLKRPVILVTGPDRGGASAWIFTRLAVFLAGGRAIRATPSGPAPPDRFDGLILGGGADIDPARWFQPEEEDPALHPETVLRQTERPWLSLLLSLLLFPVRHLLSLKEGGGVDKPRDAMELDHLQHALTRNIPILGICRGAQLINTRFRGTLYRDISSFYTEDPKIRTLFPRKRIMLTPKTRLQRILGSETCRVNALHDQSIRTLGQDLIITAREDNGVIQGVEHISRDFVIGVQWHPEYLPQIRSQRRLFQALVAAARGDFPGR